MTIIYPIMAKKVLKTAKYLPKRTQIPVKIQKKTKSTQNQNLGTQITYHYLCISLLRKLEILSQRILLGPLHFLKNIGGFGFFRGGLVDQGVLVDCWGDAARGGLWVGVGVAEPGLLGV